jgi:hypothetical protein
MAVIDASLAQIADIFGVDLVEGYIAVTIIALVGHEPIFCRSR